MENCGWIFMDSVLKHEHQIIIQRLNNACYLKAENVSSKSSVYEVTPVLFCANHHFFTQIIVSQSKV